ncbi:mucin-5AC-like [Gigantopelta aegis]|uniref:mucin-5AC-like n=1 Tax=Gigantopelta aegis TaxID=1735272 RepID=UPI001B889523|nr:mucin-5AC-like [Gigantopelta aegis]
MKRPVSYQMEYAGVIEHDVGTTSSVNTTASTPSVSTTSAPCFDDDDVDCHALNDILDICNPVTEQTRTMCPRFCGICDITYSINTITTTSGPCLDSHLVNCTSLNQIQNICSPVTEMSTTWCPQFCGLCGVTKPGTLPAESPRTNISTAVPRPTKAVPQSTQIVPQSTKTALQQSTKTVPQSTHEVPQSTKGTYSTSTVTQSMKPVPTLCYQCGDLDSNSGCSVQELALGSASFCREGYCMTDVYVHSDGVNYDVYKRCVNLTICKTEWFQESSDNEWCTSLASNGPVADLICHFCCHGDGCNKKLVPPEDLLYTES